MESSKLEPTEKELSWMGELKEFQRANTTPNHRDETENAIEVANRGIERVGSLSLKVI